MQATESTAAAMKKLSEMENMAAIGPRESARKYGLNIIKENLQDDKSQTRFIAIAKKCFRRFGKKTSIIYALKDEPGALYSTLRIFAENKINLTKIESRPSRKKLGEYLFYVDFENNRLGKQGVEKLLGKIKEKTTFLKNLGSY